MKILLTGVSGFIGKNFLINAPDDFKIIGVYNRSKDIKRFVVEKKLDNVELHQCDLSSKEQTSNLFKRIGNTFDYCLYLAGNVNVPLSKKDPKADIDSTVGTLINVLENCNVKKLVYMSTAGVYDGIVGKVGTKYRLNPAVPYCISKLMAEQYIKYFHSIGKVKNFIIIRFSGAFGKYSEKKFVTKLVRDIYLDKKDSFEIYGDGKNMINVMYVKDTIHALITALKSKKTNIVCNLGLENMNINDSVMRVAKVFGRKVHICYIPELKEQKYITFSYMSDFNDIFGFKPKYSFEQGILEFGKELKDGN
jgi:nucleoside-diphosphate-sugar epimerase